jgi:hypothetical protein
MCFSKRKIQYHVKGAHDIALSKHLLIVASTEIVYRILVWIRRSWCLSSVFETNERVEEREKE